MAKYPSFQNDPYGVNEYWLYESNNQIAVMSPAKQDLIVSNLPDFDAEAASWQTNMKHLVKFTKGIIHCTCKEMGCEHIWFVLLNDKSNQSFVSSTEGIDLTNIPGMVVAIPVFRASKLYMPFWMEKLDSDGLVEIKTVCTKKMGLINIPLSQVANSPLITRESLGVVNMNDTGLSALLFLYSDYFNGEFQCTMESDVGCQSGIHNKSDRVLKRAISDGGIARMAAEIYNVNISKKCTICLEKTDASELLDI